ncbi:MAG: ATP-binding protein, partial [Myxococcota bacterium]|nr:ATP-binding protein [Myxococcota bacterium]
LIMLNAEAESEQIVISIQDDGRGIDLGKLSQKAGQLGMEKDKLTDNEIANLIFRSGVSTAEVVSDISGRGVGMEAVKSFLESQGGGINIELMDGKSETGFCPFKFIFVVPVEAGFLSA